MRLARGRPAAAACGRPRQRRAAPARPRAGCDSCSRRSLGATRRTGCKERWTAALRRGRGRGHRPGASRRRVGRSDGQGRCGRTGPSGSAAIAPADGQRAAARAHAGPRPARLRGRRLVGPGCGRGAAGPPAPAAEAGERIADLCAAPGGKTAQLAAAGARGPCGRPLRQSASMRLASNLDRLKLRRRPARPTPTCSTRRPSTPSSSTRPARRRAPSAGTRTSPGSRARRTSAKLADLQRAPPRQGGEARSSPAAGSSIAPARSKPEEGEGQAEAFLARHAGFRPRPVDACGDRRTRAKAITAAGDLRTLPCHLPSPERRPRRARRFLRRPVRRRATGG